MEDYSLQERSISIKVLTLGTRQVTQTLYRQLVEDELTTEEGEIVPWAHVWGKVNVCTPECKGHHDRHIHVVWDNGEELRRSRVSYAFKSKDTLFDDTRDSWRRTIDPNERALIKAEMDKLERNWKSTLADLESKDQLFIAVSGVWE